MCVYLSEFVCIMCVQEHSKSKRGHKIPWNSYYRQLWAAIRVLGTEFRSAMKDSSQISRPKKQELTYVKMIMTKRDLFPDKILCSRYPSIKCGKTNKSLQYLTSENHNVSHCIYSWKTICYLNICRKAFSESQHLLMMMKQTKEEKNLCMGDQTQKILQQRKDGWTGRPAKKKKIKHQDCCEKYHY